MSDPAPATAAQKTRVFVSYSRADMAFADRLAATLVALGYEVVIDRQSLPPLEDWRREFLVVGQPRALPQALARPAAHRHVLYAKDAIRDGDAGDVS